MTVQEKLFDGTAGKTLNTFRYPTQKGKFRLYTLITVQTILLVGSFFYCRNLSFAAIELMDTNLDKAMKDVFHAFLINATVITLVFYSLFVKKIFFACKGFNQKCWPPANSDVGIKTKAYEGKAAQQQAIKLAVYSLLLLFMPLPWQISAYSNYQNYAVYIESSKTLEELQAEYESYMDETGN